MSINWHSNRVIDLHDIVVYDGWGPWFILQSTYTWNGIFFSHVMTHLILKLVSLFLKKFFFTHFSLSYIVR